MSVKKPPPGPGWKPKLVLEAPGQSSTRYCHWISPVRKIEFTRHTQACEFESLRKKHGNNEVEAWAAYRQMKVGADFRVVSPYLYDGKPNKTSTIKRKVKEEEEDSSTATSTNRKKRKMTNDDRFSIDIEDDDNLSTLSSGWKAIKPFSPLNAKFVKNAKTSQYISPSLGIRFRSYSSAKGFDSVLKKYPRDEGKAMDEYTRRVGKEKVRNTTSSLGLYISRWRTVETSGAKVQHKSNSVTKLNQNKSNSVTKLNQNKTKQVQRKSSSVSASPHLMDSPFKSCSVETSNDGLNCCDINITRKSNKTNKTSFFNERFSNKTLRVSSSLSDKNPPEKTVIFVSDRHDSIIDAMLFVIFLSHSPLLHHEEWHEIHPCFWEAGQG